MKKTVLLIGFLDSPHLARWVELLLDNTEYRFVLFSSSPGRRINGQLARLLKSRPERISTSAHSPKKPWLTFLVDLFGLASRLKKLERCLQEANPDVIHFFEMQHSGYLIQKATRRPKAKYLYSSYGSDIYWFGNQSKHREKISKVLEFTDGVFYECARDLSFMKSHAKNSCSFIKTVNSGALPTRQGKLSSNPTTILIKGYSNKWGMSLWALRQVLKKRDLIAGRYRIVMYSCDYHVPLIAKLWGALKGVEIETHLKGSLSHVEVLKLMEDSICHIAISRSDGIPSATLEAMWGGAIPIQSKTACLEDLITNGENGFLIDIDELELLSALDTVLKNSVLTKRVRERNISIVMKATDKNIIGEQIRQTYLKILTDKET